MAEERDIGGLREVLYEDVFLKRVVCCQLSVVNYLFSVVNCELSVVSEWVWYQELLEIKIN